jgi:hypothetical protein
MARILKGPNAEECACGERRKPGEGTIPILRDDSCAARVPLDANLRASCSISL